MEVLERVGTPEQKEQWLSRCSTARSARPIAMTEPNVASSDAKNIATARRARRRRVGHQRREVLHLRRRRSALQDHDHAWSRPAPTPPPHLQQSQILVPIDTPGVKILGPMCVFGHDDAPHGHMHIRFENVRVPEGEHPAGRGPRLRDLAGPPRPGPHPPLHALDRRRREGARPDGQARLDREAFGKNADRARQEHSRSCRAPASRSRPCG